MEILTSIEKRVDERNEDNIELRNYQVFLCICYFFVYLMIICVIFVCHF